MSYYQPKLDDVVPNFELDLHGHTMASAKVLLEDLFEKREHDVVRIIVVKGLHSELGPVLPAFVSNYLSRQRIRFTPYLDRGVFDVFFS